MTTPPKDSVCAKGATKTQVLRRSHFGVVLLVILGLGTLGGVVPSASGAEVTTAAVKDCDVWAYYPNIRISSARSMGCKAAAREIRRYRGAIYRVFRTPRGFSCSRVSGGSLGGQWRCVRGSQAFRFEFGD